MRSINLAKGIKTGCIGALVPALGLAAGAGSGLITAAAGVVVLSAGYFVYRFFPRSSAPAAVMASAGFIAGILWKLGFAPAEGNAAVAYLGAFALCAGGVVCRIPDSQKKYNFTGLLGALGGFISVCLLLGVLREIIHLSAGESLFAAGIIFALIKGALKGPRGRKP